MQQLCHEDGIEILLDTRSKYIRPNNKDRLKTDAIHLDPYAAGG